MDYTGPQPTFRRAYLVTTTSLEVFGVVQRQGSVWRILLFDVPDNEQPREVFTTREEAGRRLLALVSGS